MQALLLCALVAGCQPRVRIRSRIPADPCAGALRPGTGSRGARAAPLRSGGTPNPDSLDRAIARLIAYVDTIDDAPSLQMLLQYAHRRFGVSEFADARARYDRATKMPAERVFRRIVDRESVAAPADLARLGDTDVMVSAALYCDVLPLPPDYRATLDARRESGGYDLTHVLLSLELLRENSCTGVVPPGYEDSVATDVAALVAASGPPTDLEIESEALLCIVGCGHLLHPGFTQRLVGAQRADGGFSASGQALMPSRWHASGLALVVLLDSRYPTAPLIPLIGTK